MPASFEELSNELEKRQSPARFRHALAVSRLAGELAVKHGWSSEKAALAGLLHDWAKEWKSDELVTYARDHRLDVPHLSFIVRNSPNVLHGFVAADIVRRQGFTEDPEILQAIASHTLGSPRMTLPEMILYVADFASYDRTFPEAAAVRATAQTDIRAAFMESVRVKISDQLEKSRPIHPTSVEVWNRLSEKGGDR